MILGPRGWRAYHEWACSPGLPWECGKRCFMWWWFEDERLAVERLATNSSCEPPQYGYHNLTRTTYPSLKSNIHGTGQRDLRAVLDDFERMEKDRK